MSTTSITLPRSVVERIRQEARRLGVSLEEYVVEALLRDFDPRDRALEYLETAKTLLEKAREEFGRGDLRQAAEKLWGACALTIKAYAEWREGRRLTSHGELWRYKDIVADELGSWVRDSWNAGSAMHTCFYEGWCTGRDVENALKHIERLVREVEARLKGASTD